ncbi:hypothetical protein M2413_000700 [Pseudomonas putida]|nr:hypothetical protein [Pseudomonas putida]
MLWLVRLLRKDKSKTVWDIREEQFILAINSLKTLRAPLGGCISIDVEEIREQVIASREQCKDLVRRDGH